MTSWIVVIGAVALLLWSISPALSWLADRLLTLLVRILLLIWPFLFFGLLGFVAVLLIDSVA